MWHFDISPIIITPYKLCLANRKFHLKSRSSVDASQAENLALQSSPQLICVQFVNELSILELSNCSIHIFESSHLFHRLKQYNYNYVIQSSQLFFSRAEEANKSPTHTFPFHLFGYNVIRSRFEGLSDLFTSCSGLSLTNQLYSTGGYAWIMCSDGIMDNGTCEQVLERVNLYGVDGSVFGATDNCEFAWPLYIIIIIIHVKH